MRAFATAALLMAVPMAVGVGEAAAQGQVQIESRRCTPTGNCVVTPVPPVVAARIARTSSDVRITLDGRVLRYEVTETFTNRGTRIGEADYVLPLPRGAAFEDLALEIDGELVHGEALAAERARSVYEEIVRRTRDPALVEWMDFGLLRTRIFPIAPGENKRVVVRFRAVAQREGNALRIDYPGAGHVAGSTEPPVATALAFHIERPQESGTPYSPTHQLEGITQRGVTDLRVRGDASRLTLLVPLRDMQRAVITAVPFAPDSGNGFALITLSPPNVRAAAVPRDVTFVVDVSGSMNGPKMSQAQAAGRALLETLNTYDRFRLIAFSTDVQPFRDDWSVATVENLRAARAWVDALHAEGSTNIDGALRAALQGETPRGRLGIVLFLTDGAATVGERNPERLATYASAQRGEKRVFTFGVGADVQAGLIERLAVEGHGTAQFIQPNEDIEHAVGVVAQRLSTPVASNVRVRAEGVTLLQMHPSGSQDVFAGQDLVLFARYSGSGSATLVFEGDSPDGPVRWTERVTLPSRSHENAFVAKLWAVQRVGWLSAERRRAGANPELDAELRDLGTRYGIPTELTSYLVLEPGMVIPGNRRDIGDAVGAGRGGRGAPATDFAAARAAAEQRAAKSLADAAVATTGTPVPTVENGMNDAVVGGSTGPNALPDGTARGVGDRTFVWRDRRWTDTRFRDSTRTVTIKPFSSAYFAILSRMPELKPMVALGERVRIGGRDVMLVVDDSGVELLSTDALAAIARDW